MRDAAGGVQSLLLLGGGSEIGLAVARRLVNDKCRRVVLAGRDPEALAGAAGELKALGAELVERLAFDALDTTDHPRVIDKAFAHLGDVDVVLMAFGVLGDQTTFDDDPEAAADAIRVNFVGSVTVGLAAASRLRDQGHGTIIVLSSVAGERVRAANFVYGASKAGLDGFAQGLADALEPSGVRVMVVRPGFVHSKMTAGMEPAPLATTPEAVADSIAGALATGAETVWVPSPLRWLMAAMRHLPRAAWRRVAAR